MIQRLLIATTAAAGAVLSPSAAAAGQASASAISWSPYELKLRSGEAWQGQLGELEVPLLRGESTDKTMRIRFVRLPATGKPDGPPIIYLAGGPGSSGIDAARGDRSALFARLRRHGDVILLDQRGTGMSDPPPKCSTPWQFPRDTASDEASINASLEAALTRCAAEWREKGVVLEAYNNADNAADVADLVRQLGVAKARLVGISYGTFLGFVILRDHPQVVERAVFAGTEGPDHTIKLPTQADPVLAGVSKRLKASSGKPFDLEASAKRAFARLEKEPGRAKGEDGSTQLVSLYDAQFVTSFLMATSENAEALPALFEAMEAGDFAPMASEVNRLRRFYGALPAMPYAMDAVSPSTAAREKRARDLVTQSLFGNAVNFPSADLAGALGLKQLPMRYARPLWIEAPVLFVSGSLDSRTPPVNAEEMRKSAARSSHIVIEGAGHDNDLFLSTPAILDRIDAFLEGRPVGDERLQSDLRRAGEG